MGERKDVRLGATDGWISMPDGTSHYTFGFIDITGVAETDIYAYRGRAQLPAPILEVYEGDDLYLTLTNLGTTGRPDLDDPHTLHWHGFPNQIPIYDGVPEASVMVPYGRDFEYFYHPLHPGTYMYHCHMEPVEHIQMGMVGPLVVRPLLERDPARAGRKFAYNDPETEFQREYLVFLSELDAAAHKAVEGAQEYDWTEYSPAYWLLNGRSYPHTVSANGSGGSQPYPALVRANAGERVLLRFINLGYQSHSIRLLGISLHVIALDARPLKGLYGENLSYRTDVLGIAPGQTVDALFTVHAPGTYPLFNRDYHKNTNAGQSPGGMLSEVQIFASGTLPPQTGLNQ